MALSADDPGFRLAQLLARVTVRAVNAFAATQHSPRQRTIALVGVIVRELQDCGYPDVGAELVTRLFEQNAAKERGTSGSV